MTNLYSPINQIASGLVEIVNLYDNNYFSIFIDKTEVAQTYKESFPKTVIKRSFIKECVQKSGVPETALQFVYIDFETYARNAVSANYDCNDFLGDYQAMEDFIAIHGKIKSREISYLAKGIEALEVAIERW